MERDKEWYKRYAAWWRHLNAAYSHPAAYMHTWAMVLEAENRATEFTEERYSTVMNAGTNTSNV